MLPVCLSLQLILGFVRPTAKARISHRHIWDIVHSTFGRVAMIVGLANVGLGVFIYCHTYNGDFAMWAGLCAAGLGGLSLLQYLTDRQEKYAVLKNDREALVNPHDDVDLDGETDATGDFAPTNPQKSFPSKDPHAAAESTAAVEAAHCDAQVPPTHNGQHAASPVARNWAGDSDQNVKLTANLLQQHQANADSPAAHQVGVAHPDFDPCGVQTGDADHAERDQGPAWPQQQQQGQLLHQQQQQQQQWTGY
jgi:hypothetical protein